MPSPIFGSIQVNAAPGFIASLSTISQTTANAHALNNLLNPDFSLGVYVQTTLDGDLLINNPRNMPVAGVRIGFTHSQDSVGGRNVVFDPAVFIGAAAYCPRQGPKQQSIIEFISNGDGTATLVDMNAINLNLPLNIMDFGATPGVLGNTVNGASSYAAISAAIAKAVSLSVNGVQPAVFIPPGNFMVDKPIFVRNPNMKIYGAGSSDSCINAKWYTEFPILVVGPDHTTSGGGNNGPHYTTALVTGAGQALHCGPAIDGTRPTIDLAQSQWGRIPVDGSWSLEWNFKIDAGGLASGNGNALIAIAGGLKRPYPGNLFSITIDSFSGPARPQVSVLCGGNVQTFPFVGTGTIQEGVLYDIEVNWDLTHLRVFLNGVLAVNVTPTNTNGKGIQWRGYHQVYIGAGAPLNYGVGIQQDYINHVMDSFRISNSVRHTSNFTPTYAKRTFDGSTLMLVNFDNFLNECLVVQTANVGGAYLVPFCGLTVQTFNFQLKSLAFAGNWVYLDGCPWLVVDDIIHNGHSEPWVSRNGCFEFEIKNFNLNASESICRASFLGVSMAEGVFQNLKIGTSQCGVNFIGCNFVCNLLYYANGSRGIVGLRIESQGTYQFNRFVIDNETLASDMLANLIVQGVQSSQFFGSTFDAGTGPPGMPAVIAQQLSTAKSVIEFDGGLWATQDTDTALIDTTGSDAGNAQAITVRSIWNNLQASPIFKGPGRVKLYLDRSPIQLNDASYVANQGEYDIAMQAITVARTITLPALNGWAQDINIKDESGSCNGTKTITISVAGGGTIDGAATKVINTANGSWRGYFNGTNYFTR